MMALFKVTSSIAPGWAEWEGFVVRAASADRAKQIVQDKIAGQTYPEWDAKRFSDEHVIVEQIDTDDASEGIVLEANTGS